MTIRKKTLLWLAILIPYLRPDCINGSMLSPLWRIFQYIAVILGFFVIIKRVGRIKIQIVAYMLILYYGFQVVSTYMNGLAVATDILTLITMSNFLICISIFIVEDGVDFCIFVYKVLKYIIYINFISIFLFWENGIIQDSYNHLIYFWSTKNHIISILLVALVLGYILWVHGYENKYKLNLLSIVCLAEVLLLNTSTGILSLGVFLFCVFINKVWKRKISVKFTVCVGILMHVSVLFFNIQERFASLIQVLFDKNETLTGRTELWSQAFLLIPSNWLWGLGNPAAEGKSGWLTLHSWDSLRGQMEEVAFVAHNQFLEIILNGGVLCLVFFLLALSVTAYKIYKIRDKRGSNIISAALLSYIVVMITEVVYPYPPVWIFLIFASAYGYVFEEVRHE